MWSVGVKCACEGRANACIQKSATELWKQFKTLDKLNSLTQIWLQVLDIQCFKDMCVTGACFAINTEAGKIKIVQALPIGDKAFHTHRCCVLQLSLLISTAVLLHPGFKMYGHPHMPVTATNYSTGSEASK